MRYAGRVTRPVVFWHYQQWRATGVIDQIMTELHTQVRTQVKKTEMDTDNHD